MGWWGAHASLTSHPQHLLLHLTALDCTSVAYQTASNLIRHNGNRHSPTPVDKMDIDDNDDDFYAPEEPTAPAAPAAQPDGAATTAAEPESKPDQDEDLEEGEEEDEGGAMDEDDSSDDVSMNSTLGLLLPQHCVIWLMLPPTEYGDHHRKKRRNLCRATIVSTSAMLSLPAYFSI